MPVCFQVNVSRGSEYFPFTKFMVLEESLNNHDTIQIYCTLLCTCKVSSAPD